MADIRLISRKKLYIASAAAVLLVILVGSGLILIIGSSSTSPVPRSIKRTVTFKIYFPQQKKLPAGYSLDTSSFKLAQPGVVIFSVKKGGDTIIFSEEQQPAGNVITQFNATYIPLRTTLSSPLGQAEVGAYGNGQHLRTLASLPIRKGPWLIITAPPNMKNGDLKAILNALTT